MKKIRAFINSPYFAQVAYKLLAILWAIQLYHGVTVDCQNGALTTSTIVKYGLALVAIYDFGLRNASGTQEGFARLKRDLLSLYRRAIH